eukprot:Colp12_sorted_trinity150504_noHs@23949
MSTMIYEAYRKTTLGSALTDSLDELITAKQIHPEMALKILAQFDKSISNALATKAKNRINFKGHLKTYRNCDNVWTFEVRDVTFRLESETLKADKLSIVACDGKAQAKDQA